MGRNSLHWLLSPLLVAALVAATLFACSSTPSSNDSFTDTDGGDGSTSGFGNGQLDQLAVEPAQATIEVLNGAAASQQFKLVAKDKGQSTPITAGVAWSVDRPQAGTVDATGLYKASGAVGAVVRVIATYKGKTAFAQLTVKLHIQRNPGSLPGSAQTTLKGATTPDPSVVWAYPYDGTVFPRGLAATQLMWNGGAANDSYYVHITSPTFELESFDVVQPPARWDPGDTLWQQFVDSTSGAAKLQVARLSGQTATVIANHTWSISPASMRGTIYYWANYQGRVMRIKPGANAPDDFSASVLTPTATVNCTMTCHTVSADGSTLISGGDILGGSYDLRQNKVRFNLGGPLQSAQQRAWNFGAVSPDGKYVMKHGWNDGLYDGANGAKVVTTGIEGTYRWFPAFAPDGSSVAYVDLLGGSTTYGHLKMTNVDLKLLQGSNDRSLVPPGSDPASNIIGYPSVSPDGKWVVYQRGNSHDTRGVHRCATHDAQGNCTDPKNYLDYTNRGNLYLVSSSGGQEIKLAALNGDAYPFAAGNRDRSWNFEPTFAPVAAGGYFWIVFTSRRSYGNADARETACVQNPPSVDVNGGKNPDITCTKQLWVAAIDQNPKPGQDPSHPAFRLPGQAINTLNMRGFWALDPCKQDGQGCGSGTECCGGFCDPSADGGLVCKSTKGTCAEDGDRCDQTSDCCNAGFGVTCINHVCSEPTPR